MDRRRADAGLMRVQIYPHHCAARCDDDEHQEEATKVHFPVAFAASVIEPLRLHPGGENQEERQLRNRFRSLARPRPCERRFSIRRRP
jgi:hypothetical protein